MRDGMAVYVDEGRGSGDLAVVGYAELGARDSPPLLRDSAQIDNNGPTMCNRSPCG